MAEATLMHKPALRGAVPFAVVLAAIVVLFVMQPAWRGYPPPPVESYAIAPDAFEAKVDAQVKAHATGETLADGIPVIRPPAGDVYVLARRWHFWPVVELEEGRTYRLHVASADILHGFALDRIDLLLAPGQAHAFEVTAGRERPLVMQCSEYCGLEHNRMKATLRVVPPKP